MTKDDLLFSLGLRGSGYDPKWEQDWNEPNAIP